MIMRFGVAAALVVAAGSASADVQVSKMKFTAPAHFQETASADGKVIVDGNSDLKIVAFIVKKQGSFDDAAKQIVADLPKSSLRLDGAPIKTVELGKASDSESNGAKVRWGQAKIDGKAAQFAIVQRDKETVFFAGVATTSGGKLAFASMLSKLQPAGGASEESSSSEPLPELGAFAAVKDITASSTYADKSKKDLYGAWRVLEFEVTDPQEDIPKTAWCEGKPDEGIGEGITINFQAPTKIASLDIAAGVWLTEKLYKSNNQITSLAISLDGGPAKKVAPPAARSEWLEVPVGKSVSSVKITIDAVKKGKMNDSCISAVRLGGENGALDIVRAVPQDALAALPAAYAAVGKAISDPNRAGLEKLVLFPFTYESSDWFFEGNQKPVKHANWKSIEAACKKKKPGCPAGPNTGGRTDGARVTSVGSSGAVVITFPSRREVADQWHFTWRKGEWKLTDMVSGTP